MILENTRPGTSTPAMLKCLKKVIRKKLSLKSCQVQQQRIQRQKEAVKVIRPKGGVSLSVCWLLLTAILPVTAKESGFINS